MPNASLISRISLQTCHRVQRSLVIGLLVLLVAATPAIAHRPKSKPKPDPLPPAISDILTEPEITRGSWGIEVISLDSGREIFSLNADKLFTPASNTKLFTTAAAFALVGGDYKFRTTVETSSPSNKIDKSGRLTGDLTLVGRGDPNLSDRVLPYNAKSESAGSSTQALEEMADALVKLGLKEVDGDIIGDDTFYDFDRYPEGWDWDDLQYDYGAPVSALTLNDNVIAVQVSPGAAVGDTAFLSVSPDANYFAIHNRTITTAAGSGNHMDLRRDPGSHEVTFFGDIPLDDKGHTEYLAVEDSAEFAARVFRHLLEQRGIAVLGGTRARHRDPASWSQPTAVKPPAPTNVLAEHWSHPFVEDLTVINKVSQNLHAELALRLIGQTHWLPRDAPPSYVPGPASTADVGLNFRREFLHSAGIKEEDALLLADGSGLSRINLVSPRTVVMLLRYASTQTWGAAFDNTLPIAGVDGSLAHRFSGTAASGTTPALPSPAKDRVHAKTGSLTHVNALSGYATTMAGERVAFSIFSNSQSARAKLVVAAIDQIVEAIVAKTQPPSKK